MIENRAVGPNLKTYFYYTNHLAESKDVKGVIVLATGMEGTGAVYDEIGDYLDQKGYALYVIDEWGYGKTGKVTKGIYKNWNKKSFHFASYNIHALSSLAKGQHPDAPIYLIGNDFGAMLSLYLLKEFPEVIDKIVTIGWGAPTTKDYTSFIHSFLRKVIFYDSGECKAGHRIKNAGLGMRFERHNKYSWLSSDLEQVSKIVNAGYIDEAGTVGHYFYYYKAKIKIPTFTKWKKADHDTPILFLSGDNDLTTHNGRATKKICNSFRKKHFNSVETQIVSGRHQLLFEINRFEILDKILMWLDGGKVGSVEIDVKDVSVQYPEVIDNENKINEEYHVIPKEEIEIIDNGEDIAEPITQADETYNEFLEAEDDLLIKTNKESE